MPRKLRLLCLHGFRTSASILQYQIERAKWGEGIHELLDLTFLDAPWPASGPSDVEGRFSPPFFEWYCSNDDARTFKGIEESISYIVDFMKMHGPFDGLLGFSQGSMMAAALTGFQQKRIALTGAAPIRLLIVIGGGVPSAPLLRTALTDVIACPSLHFLGEFDFLRERGRQLTLNFQNPIIIKHPKGHVVPDLNEEAKQTFISFLSSFEDVPTTVL